VRDHVFNALRNLRSFAYLGGTTWPDTTGRAVMIGAMRSEEAEIDTLFNGVGHAPAALSETEAVLRPSLPEAEAWNMPDWLVDVLRDSLGADAWATAQALCARAPISIRVNLRKTSRGDVQAGLAAAGIDTRVNPLSDAALTALTNTRQLAQNPAYFDGMFDFQDASSQAVVRHLEVTPDAKVLDFCAGGGGKSLALAMTSTHPVHAYDIDPRRMRDIPERAERAQAQVRVIETESDLRDDYDLVLVDAPCSGSGSWRRAPDAKWRFSPERLAELRQIQLEVLNKAARFVAPGGVLAYATCSVLACENDGCIAAFLDANPQWSELSRHQWPVSDDGDGFYLTQLKIV